MGIMKKIGDLVSPNDPELVEKTLARLDEQDRWNDVFSTKLIEILDRNDALKSELRQKLSKAAADLNAAKDTLIQAKELTVEAQQRAVAAEGALNEARTREYSAESLFTAAAQRARRTTQVAVIATAAFMVGTLWFVSVSSIHGTLAWSVPAVSTLVFATLVGVSLRRSR